MKWGSKKDKEKRKLRKRVTEKNEWEKKKLTNKQRNINISWLHSPSWQWTPRGG
jgi:hypothetical protein